MYLGVVDAPTLSVLSEFDIDMSYNPVKAVLGFSQTVKNELSKVISLENSLYKGLELPMWHALENIMFHGSGQCRITVGMDDGLTLIIRDEQGGFDPSRITEFHRHGYGYATFLESAALVGHSGDGKATYITNKNL